MAKNAFIWGFSFSRLILFDSVINNNLTYLFLPSSSCIGKANPFSVMRLVDELVKQVGSRPIRGLHGPSGLRLLFFYFFSVFLAYSALSLVSLSRDEPRPVGSS